jgi:hypothetical protein
MLWPLAWSFSDYGLDTGLMQNLGKLAEVTEAEHVSTQLLPLFTELTQDGGWLSTAALGSGGCQPSPAAGYSLLFRGPGASTACMDTSPALAGSYTVMSLHRGISEPFP